MKMLSDYETKKFLCITLIPCLSGCIISAFFDPFAAISILLVSIFLISSFLILTKKRYKRTRKLQQAIDSILIGNDAINIDDYGEGEFAVLESDIKKILIRLREQRDILHKERTYLADSIADISHQLKTPLTSINIILSLLEAPDITENRRNELLRELSSLISRTEHLVSVLLKISKIDAGAVQFEKKRTKLSELMEKSADPLMIPMDIKNQRLAINADDIYLDCDFSWCVEAFGNILKNCAEHTPENGEITVTAKDTPIFTEIVISDTGCGINEEDLPHIFERFYKGKNSSKESFGVGLNLAKMIISGHNGTVKAENNKASGAKFTVRFYKQVV